MIDEVMEEITTTTLTAIGKQPYELKSFVTQQEEELKKKTEKFMEKFNLLKVKLMVMYRLFIYKKEEIQREWLRFVDK
jgi:hypothetical protein